MRVERERARTRYKRELREKREYERVSGEGWKR